MEGLNLFFSQLALVEASQNFKSFFITILSGKPARSLGNDEDDEDHGDQEEALEDGGDAPDEAGADSILNCAESVVDPVDHHDTC